MTKKQFTDQIARPAIRMKVGGFRPTNNPLASWFGKVLVGRLDEDWPSVNGNPMLALCQINLNEFGFKPEPVSDIAFITIFINAEEIPNDGDENGTNWCLRTYHTIEELVPLDQPESSPIKPMQMIPELIEQDFPHYEDCPLPVPAQYDADYYDLFSNVAGIKFGGWPTLIQGEINWTTSTEPAFAFQIDSVAKAHWQWGDNGVAYFGRNPDEHDPNQWIFSWQSY